MVYAIPYSEKMAKKKYVGVQFDAEMLKMADDIAASTGIPRADVLRRALLFLSGLHGVEVREVLGVNPTDIKAPDIIALLWEKLRGSQSRQSAEPSIPPAALPIEEAEGAGESGDQQTPKRGHKRRKKA